MPAVFPVLTSKGCLGSRSAHTPAHTPDGERSGVSCDEDRDPRRSADSLPSCAANGNVNIEEPRACDAPPNQFDCEAELAVPIDLTRHAMGYSGPNELGSGADGQLTRALHVKVLEQEHHEQRALRQTDREHLTLSYGNVSTGPAAMSFRNFCRVRTASPPMAYDYKTGEIAGVLYRG